MFRSERLGCDDVELCKQVPIFCKELLPPSQRAARKTEDRDIWKTGKKLGLQTTQWEMVDLKDIQGHTCTAAQLACDAGSSPPFSIPSFLQVFLF